MGRTSKCWMFLGALCSKGSCKVSIVNKCFQKIAVDMIEC
jgi:hypothetical protein